MDAFDADVLIYAALPDDRLGGRIAALFPQHLPAANETPVGCGSVLLLPEMLTKPRRLEAHDQIETLRSFLTWLDLRPFDLDLAEHAVALGARYRLHAPDAIHLATAIQADADRFITNNRKDFPRSIEEIKITYPDDLPDPDSPDATDEAADPA
jgi:predicted nucleic acid-binding protein